MERFKPTPGQVQSLRDVIASTPLIPKAPQARNGHGAAPSTAQPSAAPRPRREKTPAELEAESQRQLAELAKYAERGKETQ